MFVPWIIAFAAQYTIEGAAPNRDKTNILDKPVKSVAIAVEPLITDLIMMQLGFKKAP